YITLAEKLFDDRSGCFTSGWNFGPVNGTEIPVSQIVEAAGGVVPELKVSIEEKPQPHEAHLLALDSSKALSQLHWHPRLPIGVSLELTFQWYKTHLGGGDISALTTEQIQKFSGL